VERIDRPEYKAIRVHIPYAQAARERVAMKFHSQLWIFAAMGELVNPLRWYSIAVTAFIRHAL